MIRVLIVDDDVDLCEMLSEYLGLEGFVVDTAQDGLQGVEQALSGCYDILMLDVMLPNLNGFDCLRRIRTESNTPVMMLTARGEDVDRIVGLEMGADDYLPKPFNPRELIARLRAILRRSSTDHSGKVSIGSPEIIRAGSVEVNTATRQVICAGTLIDLTSTEYNVLEVLLSNAGKVVTKETLSEQALGRKLMTYDRSIDVHVSKLRRKLAPEPNRHDLIKTIRSIGYQFTGI